MAVKAALPQVGDVFMTRTSIFNNGDHADDRRVVVVRAPVRVTDMVTVIQRSTKKKLPGVDHPVNAALLCDKPGRWVLAYQRAARCDTFLAGSDLLGRLGDPWLKDLIEMWERS